MMEKMCGKSDTVKFNRGGEGWRDDMWRDGERDDTRLSYEEDEEQHGLERDEKMEGGFKG